MRAPLPGERMQRIAREMNFSESTFILPAETPGTDARIRIFTPGTEMPMAGHPTIGSTFALAHVGFIPPGAPRFVCELGVGPVPVDLEWQGARPALCVDDAAEPDVRGAGAAIAPTWPPRSASRKRTWSRTCRFRPCRAECLSCSSRCATNATVDRAVTDASAFRRLGERDRHRPARLPVFASRGRQRSTAACSPRSSASSRIPATGSASGPLGCYLVQHGLVEGDQARHIISMQGVAMGRPSQIHIAIQGARDAITQVKVGGQAVLVAQGEFVV